MGGWLLALVSVALWLVGSMVLGLGSLANLLLQVLPFVALMFWNMFRRRRKQAGRTFALAGGSPLPPAPPDSDAPSSLTKRGRSPGSDRVGAFPIAASRLARCGPTCQNSEKASATGRGFPAELAHCRWLPNATSSRL